MKSRFNYLLLLSTLIFANQAIADNLPNPFVPQFVPEPTMALGPRAEGEGIVASPPTKAYPVAGYFLAGTLVSGRKSAALMVTKTGTTFTLLIGDVLGKNNAILKEIGVDHVVFREGNKEAIISINNGFVSNK